MDPGVTSVVLFVAGLVAGTFNVVKEAPHPGLARAEMEGVR